MIKLHGLEIKVGDRVWTAKHGWTDVTFIEENCMYKIITDYGWYNE